MEMRKRKRDMKVRKRKRHVDMLKVNPRLVDALVYSARKRNRYINALADAVVLDVHINYWEDRMYDWLPFSRGLCAMIMDYVWFPLLFGNELEMATRNIRWGLDQMRLRWDVDTRRSIYTFISYDVNLKIVRNKYNEWTLLRWGWVP